jgi:hypothetical protein
VVLVKMSSKYDKTIVWNFILVVVVVVVVVFISQ